METRRGRQKVERGPVSDYVAENVTSLRKSAGMSQQELSARLAEVGRPMLPSAISKLESRERGVDVDDLVALAVVLGVNPSRLLLPDESGDGEIPLTPARTAPGWAAWQWADAYAPLPTRSEADGYNSDDEIEQFQLRSRPGELRRQQQHPLMRAAKAVTFSASRVLHHVGKPSNPTRDRPDLGLETTLTVARRAVVRFSGELDAIEEQEADRG